MKIMKLKADFIKLFKNIQWKSCSLKLRSRICSIKNIINKNKRDKTNAENCRRETEIIN